MAPSLQLTSTHHADDPHDLEDVRLLDSYEEEEEGRRNGGEFAVEMGDGRKMKRVEISVTGMTCAACSNSIETALMAIKGVDKGSVSLLQNKADVVFDPQFVQDEDIRLAIEDAGFDAEIISESKSIEPVSKGTLTGQFRIGGMTCAACVNSVENILRKLPGVKRAVVALATSFGEVGYEPTLINKEEIINAIEDAGFEASFVQSSAQDKIILGISGLSTEMDMQLLEGMLGNIKRVKIWISESCSVCYWQTILCSGWKGTEEWYNKYGCFGCTWDVSLLLLLSLCTSVWCHNWFLVSNLL